MFRPLTSAAPARRRGALLIAVLGLLTLFAIFALFFVFYADAEATGSRIYRESQSTGEDGPPNDFAIAAWNATLRSILFDDYDVGGVLNPLRGHSLARSMFGWNGLVGPAASAPFSGHGTFHMQAPHGADQALWINVSAPFTTSTGPLPGTNTYWLDPEWTLYRTSAELGMAPGTIMGRPQTYIPKNAPYTYPDLKDLILASLSPATGEVLVPSLHRNWLFNANNTVAGGIYRLAPWDPRYSAASPPPPPNPYIGAEFNTDWVNPEGRTRILRPRPVDQLTPAEINGAIGSNTVPPNFVPFPPAPPTPQQLRLFNLITRRIAEGQIIAYPPINANGLVTGDVQNLQGGVGVQKNDSILIDIGMPPRLWNGKWIKPLASVLVSDLDGLLNLNVHGNMRGSRVPDPGPSPGYHASYAGYGPHEVNLGAVLGSTDAVNVVMARYGVTAWQPNTNYFTNQVVVNAGNFYRCANMGVPPAGPPPGWRSALTGPGPTGSYTGPAYNMDNQVQWENVSINLARNGTSTLNYDRAGNRVPTYAGVNFDAGGNSPSLQLPSFTNSNEFRTSPTFTSTGTQDFFDDGVFDAETYNKYLNHPLLFNPSDWPAGIAGRRLFPLSDTKRFNLRYAANRDWYLQTDVARSNVANASLIGTPGTYSGNNYRLDGAHNRRNLITTHSHSLDLPGWVGNFNTSVAGPLTLIAGQLHPTNAAFTGSFAGGSGADFVGPVTPSWTDYRNPRAALGPIDLNRPLADYRFDTTLPLSGTNVTAATSTAALVDRHNLARDILGRLILATGANATVFSAASGPYQPGDVWINAAVGSTDYNAIRYLAQLAANMVDTLDNDDISTTFVWHSGGTWTTPDTITVVDSTTLPTMIAAGAALTPTGLVYGVEKSRLAIGESYGELSNGDEVFAGAPALPARVRFFVELMNPTATPYAGTGTTTAPLGDGSVKLFDPADGFNPYQLVITREGGTVATALSDPTNVTGSLPAAADISFNFSTAAFNQRNVSPLPNGNSWNYVPQPNGTQGFIVVGALGWTNPHTDAGGNAIEFNPDTTVAPYDRMILGTAAGATAMEYSYGAVPTAATLEGDNLANPLVGLRRHVVLLRRLANPYLFGPTAANPYITVDAMDWVPAFDAVARGGGDVATRPAKGMMNITTAGFESTGLRYAVGKAQPYAGLANANAYAMGNNAFPLINSFPNSMVLAQNPTTAPGAGVPKHTFFRHNGRNDGSGAQPAPTAQTYTGTTMNMNGTATETIMAPFDWFVHFDRPIVNQFELFSVQAVKPHEVTQNFLQPPIGAGPLRRGRGQAPWLGTTLGEPTYDPNGLPVVDGSVANPNRLTNNGLYRALDVLRVKSWMHGTALGGKVHGKININTIQDIRVLRALLDAQLNNGNGNSFLPGDVDALWTSYVTGPGGRTVNLSMRPLADNSPVYVPFAGPSVYDVPNSSVGIFDRPFRPLSAPELSPDFSTTALLSRGGSGIQDTLLRVPAPWGPGLYYSVGQRVANLEGNAYVCTTAGTSLGGPTGTGSSISDGTAIWSYYASAGQPLLWSTNPPWTPGSYSVGQRVTNNGNTYICTTAGTSNPPGPAGTGSGISDGGTAFWNYYAVHPYFQGEMARKMFNNTTTTSNAFAVSVTIVFHEVRMNGVNPMSVDERTTPSTFYNTPTPPAGTRYLIGKEVYKDVPGDLRQQFYAVVDRSNLGLAPVFGGPPPTVLQPQPFSAALDAATSGFVTGQLTPIVSAEASNTNNMPARNAATELLPPSGSYNIYLANVAYPGGIFIPGGSRPFTTGVNAYQVVVYADGRPVTLGANSVIVVGVGAGQEPTPLIVNYVNQDGSLNVGNSFLGLPSPSRPHAVGELVANFVPGNPGPQPFFDYRLPQYGGVVPYARRVR